MKRISFVFFTVFCLVGVELPAQNDLNTTLDSLKEELASAMRNDSLTVANDLYVQIGRAYESVHKDSAITWYKKQVYFAKTALFESVNRDSLIGSVYLDISYLLGFIGYPTKAEVDLSLAYSDSAFNVFEKSESYQMAVRAYNNKGLAQINQNRYEDAVSTLIIALGKVPLVEELEKQNYLYQGLYLNVGKAYIGLEQWPLAIENTQKALAAHNEPRFEMIALNNLAAVYLELELPDSTVKYAKRSFALADSLGDDYHILLTKVNEAEALLKLHEFDKALPIIESNIEISEQFEYPYGIASGYNQKAQYYSGEHEYDEALKILEKAEEIALDIADQELLLDTWKNLEEVHYQLNNFEQAYYFQRQVFNVKDSLNSVENTQNFNELLLRFQTSEKERQIMEQDLELKEKESALAKRNRQITSIVASVFFLFIFGFVIVLRSRQIKERKHQAALLAEKEKGLVAIISATEEERKRISKDLHDGIGQKLTALRLGLLNLKDKVGDEQVSRELKEFSDEFKKSAEDVRQLSHRMMPRALMEQGLVQALEDLLESTFKFSQVDYSFDYYHVDKRYPERVEISLYRIAQELLNNALKHSDASEIQVQLLEVEKRVMLIVEDNGKGISKELPMGQGFHNIKSRLEIMNGVVNYEPGPRAGMLATVIIPV